MYSYAPDPHPGRCLNYRVQPCGQTVRCLDYEGTEHACRFPIESSSEARHGNIYALRTRSPKPWVRPGDECLQGQAHYWEYEILLDNTTKLSCTMCGRESRGETAPIQK